ncbi:uncharacterized protein LOC131668622 [Phymastichus coffea]|uniref:uncharacterized protein LOC131668622 n=1 Tax=Phymastichus coffea TaxID=108790 RepID=UPI00273A861B|nr:uncharacterized protein LOC131668622 [Phymastichus coffea]
MSHFNKKVEYIIADALEDFMNIEIKAENLNLRNSNLIRDELKTKNTEVKLYSGVSDGASTIDSNMSEKMNKETGDVEFIDTAKIKDFDQEQTSFSYNVLVQTGLNIEVGDMMFKDACILAVSSYKKNLKNKKGRWLKPNKRRSDVLINRVLHDKSSPQTKVVFHKKGKDQNEKTDSNSGKRKNAEVWALLPLVNLTRITTPEWLKGLSNSTNSNLYSFRLTNKSPGSIVPSISSTANEQISLLSCTPVPKRRLGQLNQKKLEMDKPKKVTSNSETYETSVSKSPKRQVSEQIQNDKNKKIKSKSAIVQKKDIETMKKNIYVKETKQLSYDYTEDCKKNVKLKKRENFSEYTCNKTNENTGKTKTIVQFHTSALEYQYLTANGSWLLR